MRPTTQNLPDPAQKIDLSSKQYRVAISKNGSFRHKRGFFSKLLDHGAPLSGSALVGSRPPDRWKLLDRTPHHMRLLKFLIHGLNKTSLSMRKSSACHQCHDSTFQYIARRFTESAVELSRPIRRTPIKIKGGAKEEAANLRPALGPSGRVTYSDNTPPCS
jgi:hypothetical protein